MCSVHTRLPHVARCRLRGFHTQVTSLAALATRRLVKTSFTVRADQMLETEGVHAIREQNQLVYRTGTILFDVLLPDEQLGSLGND